VSMSYTLLGLSVFLPIALAILVGVMVSGRFEDEPEGPHSSTH